MPDSISESSYHAIINALEKQAQNPWKVLVLLVLPTLPQKYEQGDEVELVAKIRKCFRRHILLCLKENAKATSCFLQVFKAQTQFPGLFGVAYKGILIHHTTDLSIVEKTLSDIDMKLYMLYAHVFIKYILFVQKVLLGKGASFDANQWTIMHRWQKIKPPRDPDKPLKLGVIFLDGTRRIYKLQPNDKLSRLVHYISQEIASDDPWILVRAFPRTEYKESDFSHTLDTLEISSNTLLTIEAGMLKEAQPTLTSWLIGVLSWLRLSIMTSIFGSNS